MKITVQHGNHSFEISDKDIKEDEIAEAVHKEKPGITYFGYPVYDTVYMNIKKRYVICPACEEKVYL